MPDFMEDYTDKIKFSGLGNPIGAEIPVRPDTIIRSQNIRITGVEIASVKGIGDRLKIPGIGLRGTAKISVY